MINNHQHESLVTIYSWIIILTIIVTSFLLIGNNYKYNKYMITEGIVINQDNNFYVKTYIKKDFINNIFDKLLIINNKHTHFKIINIGNEYLLDKQNLYVEVILKINLNNNLLIQNNLINLKWLLGKTTFINEVIKNTQKGLIQWNN